MSNWRQVADRVKQDKGGWANRDNRDETTLCEAIDPIVPNVPWGLSRIVLSWRRGVGSLNPDINPPHVPAWHWRMLCSDARWIMHSFGPVAAERGWSAGDLFGFASDGAEGGLVDRLFGSRALVLGGQHAHWRHYDSLGWMKRGDGEGLPLLWEVCRHG